MPYMKCKFCKHEGIQALDIDVCPNCLKYKGDSVKIYAIKKYLEKHPGTKLREISEKLKIDMKTLDKYVDEGSIQLVGAVELDEKERDRQRKVQNLRQQLSDMENYDKSTKVSNPYRNRYGNSQLVIDLQEKMRKYDDGHGSR